MIVLCMHSAGSRNLTCPKWIFCMRQCSGSWQFRVRFKIWLHRTDFCGTVVKVDSIQRRNVLFSQNMRTTIHQLVGCVCLPVGQHQPSCTYDSGILTSETSDFTVLVMWLYNSPDLKPVDYNIWGCMQECRYKNPLCNLVQLKQWPVVIRADFIQTTVD